MADFQQQVYTGIAAGVEGTFKDHTPRAVTSRIAETALTVCYFAWGGTDPLAQCQNTGTGQPLGLVIRDQTGIITTYLASASMTIPVGQVAEIAATGGVYAKAAYTATAGQKVFAVLDDGTLKFAAAGATVAGAIETPWYVVLGGASGVLLQLSTYNL